MGNPFNNLFQSNKEASTLNEEIVYGPLADLLDGPDVCQDPNPRLNSFRNPKDVIPNINIYASCPGVKVINYLKFLKSLPNKTYTKHIGKQGTDFAISKLLSNLTKAYEKADPKLNWMTYCVGYGNELNPIIDLDFFIHEQEGQGYVCLRINFLWEILKDYNTEANELNEYKESKAFLDTLESGKLFLPQGFMFYSDLCMDKDTGLLNPYQWGAIAPFDTLEPVFIDYVRSLPS